MAIQDCVDYIKGKIGENITLSSSESYPTEHQMTGIFCITMESSGLFEGRDASWGQSFHDVTAFILGAKTNMLQVYKTLAGEMENIAIDLMKDPTLGGKCDTFESINYDKATLNLSGVDYVGYQFTVTNIKLGRSLT